MKNYTLFALGVLYQFPFSATASGVTDLTDVDFNGFVSKYAVAMVEFYDPSCDVCREVEPIYGQAATSLNLTDNVAFARVDCTNYLDLCKQYETPIYPTFRLFQGSHESNIRYDGPREADKIQSFAERRVRPVVADISQQDIYNIKKREEYVVVGYFGSEDTDSKKTFGRIAEEHIDYYFFASINNAEEATRAGVTQPAIIIHKQGKVSSLAKFQGKFEEDDVADFINLKTIPLVAEYDLKWSWKYFGEGALDFVGLFANSTSERDELAKLVEPIAKKLTGQLRFATFDLSTPEFTSYFGVGNRTSAVFVIRSVNGTFYHTPPGEKLTKGFIYDWLKNYLNGELTGQSETPRSSETENVPDVADDNVLVATKDTFADLVINNDHDVLVEFYAPWCGHCKRLKPVYDQVAAAYNQADSRIRIVKIDSTGNEIEEFPITSFPTIRLFRAGAKDEPVAYRGDRSMEDLTAFVREHATNLVNAKLEDTQAKDEL